MKKIILVLSLMGLMTSLSAFGVGNYGGECTDGSCNMPAQNENEGPKVLASSFYSSSSDASSNVGLGSDGSSSPPKKD